MKILSQKEKPIQQKNPDFPKKKRFEELPRKESPVKPLRITKANKEADKRPRAGKVQMAPNLQGKPKIIEDGRKIK
ncbi:MAG: hypothetical protein IJ193_09625 [Bacilli bacterium]|nr:hypothetical protein [Bacilli bacterium]